MKKNVFLGLAVVVLIGGLISGGSNTKAENESQTLAIQEPEIIVGIPVTVVDKNRQGVYVGLTGLTVPLSDEVYEILEEINKFGGLQESTKIIDIKDDAGNVVLKIPEELESELKDKGSELILKHNTSVQEYMGAKNISGKFHLNLNQEWPLQENSIDKF
ncbi:hypothetical protein E8L90_24280 [Brevibacillus antibioticus]|uniref:Uncharacterized protein n=1 Tax=Brevibacillus antibioticus TaxID=2570228 RepID=A0A4U2YBV4_9BACL|nr:hypothetical protein [Brevibacillus antibioticus]TKI58258.1 hypothetical protein E8L90_24280 [Brevibacillus antibioticus]